MKESFEILSPEYSAEAHEMLQREKERLGVFERMGKKSKLIIAGFLAMSAMVIGEGAMQEAHGQAGARRGSATESVFDKYSGEAGRIGQRYQDAGDRAKEEVERTRERANQRVDRYRQQREINVDRPDVQIQIRQGYGGQEPNAPTLEQRHFESQEQIDELALQALRVLYDIPEKSMAKDLIQDFANQIRQSVGDAAEVLSANLPRFMNLLNNKPDGAFDSEAFDAFVQSLKSRPGMREVLDSAHFKTAPRPQE